MKYKPISIDIDALYSNINLLSKYNKEIPKTWDELLETASYILNEEKKKNNTDLIGYNGLFNDGESGTLSIYEFIRSFRDSKYSPNPKIRSKATFNSLKMAKKIMNEISSDDIFKSNESYTIEKINTGKVLFSKFWYLPHPSIYKTTPLPGLKKDTSGSIIGAYNVAVCTYSEENKKKASIEVIKFITSKKIQRKFIIEKGTFSAIRSFYDEEKLCSFMDCELFKDVRPFQGLNFDISNSISDYFYEKYRKYTLEYIIAFITYGNIFNFVPILYKFIINFPVENCFSKWVNKHRYYFLLIFVLIITIFNILIINTSYDIITISILDIEKFQKCKMKNLFGKTIIQFTIIFEFIIIIWTMFLIFLEWNIKETYYDTRLLILVTFTDTLSLLIYCIINEINIENYIAYNIMLICDLFIFSISNYIFLYIFRIFIVLMNNDQDENAIGSFIKKNNEMGIFISDSDSPNRLNTSLSSDLNSSMEIFIIKEGNKGSKFTSRILDFHSREDLN
eukprot:jgi/Orpsp1_1/1179067/evm.model.c7180000067801.1